MTHSVEHPHCDGIHIETCWIVRFGKDGRSWARQQFMEQLDELKRRCGRYAIRFEVEPKGVVK